MATDSKPPMDTDQRNRTFVREFTRHSRSIYGYILTLVLSPADADEVFQETSAVLWEKFDRFEQGTSFAAWACRVAYFEVHNFRKRERGARPGVSDKFIEIMAEESQSLAAELDDRNQALHECLGKLPPDDRQIIEQRYHQNLSPGEIAKLAGRSDHAIYRALNRIHETLMRCIDRTVQAWEGGRS